MFAVIKLNLKNCNQLLVFGRPKSKVHWAKLRKKNSPKYKAMEHFDDFYASVFNKQWEPIKEALLRRQKYVAVINNFGEPEETMDYLSQNGAHSLQNLMEVQKKFDENNKQDIDHNTNTEDNLKEKQDFKKFTKMASDLQKSEISSIYPQNEQPPEKLEVGNIRLGNIELTKLEESNKNLEKLSKSSQKYSDDSLDMSRMIDPSTSLSESLYQYIPATKLKGMEDWVPESVQYSFIPNDKDFPLTVEEETKFHYPEYLKVLTYEMGSQLDKFPHPKRTETGMFNYYPMDCGSVLPVLALCLKPGDRVLDLCSAPGGKALLALQTMYPSILICNDSSQTRCNRIRKVFRDYLIDFENTDKWNDRLMVTCVDGAQFQDQTRFDKVLVDVPCTTDRLSVNEDDNNIFRPDRVKERLLLPEKQAQLLTNALKLTKTGGSVVYSTCSLSPLQNDGVVHRALTMAFEMYGITAVVRDLTSSLQGLRSTLKFATGEIAPRYGLLVTPSVDANFGPMYVSKLVRTR